MRSKATQSILPGIACGFDHAAGPLPRDLTGGIPSLKANKCKRLAGFSKSETTSGPVHFKIYEITTRIYFSLNGGGLDLGLDSPTELQALTKLTPAQAEKPVLDSVEVMKQQAARQPAAAQMPTKGEEIDPFGGTVVTDDQGSKTFLYKDGAMRVERGDQTGYTLTPRADGTFLKHSWAPAPKHFWLPDQNRDQVLSASQVLAQKKDALLPDSLSYIKDAGELKTFRDNLQRFEERASTDKVSTSAIAQTYQQVDTLLTAKGDAHTNSEERIALAEQVIALAADPGKVRQGANNTCGPTSVESAAYTRHPDKAARVVLDTALTGRYVSLDETTVYINPAPQGESLTTSGGRVERSPGPDQRSYASQIFQVTALNEILQNNFRDKDASYFVDQSGEHAVIGMTDKKGRDRDVEYSYVGTDSASLAALYKAVTGDGSLQAISHNDNFQRNLSGPSPVIRSESDLNQVLSQAQLPAVILLNADNAPLDQPAMDSRGRFLDGNGRGHFVLITKYNRGANPSAEIRNPQGEGFPYGKGGELSVHDLNLATLPRKEEIAGLQADVQNQTGEKRGQPVQQLELLRMELEEGQISHAQAERELKRIISTMSKFDKDRPHEHRLIGMIAEISNVSQVSLLAMGVNP